MIIQKHQEAYYRFIILSVYCRNEPALIDDGAIENFVGNGASFKSKLKITGKTSAGDNKKDVKITVTLKYLNNFGKLLKRLYWIVKLIFFEYDHQLALLLIQMVK